MIAWSTTAPLLLASTGEYPSSIQVMIHQEQYRQNSYNYDRPIGEQW
jgi:hypothetical protein